MGDGLVEFSDEKFWFTGRFVCFSLAFDECVGFCMEFSIILIFN